MGSDVGMEVRQPYCSWLQYGGSFMASPSWFPLYHKGHRRSNCAGRFHVLDQEAAASDAAHGRRSWRWRSFFRRLVKEGKGLHSGSKPPPLTFHYDIVSYYKNFDDGCCSCGEGGQLAGRCRQW